MLSSAIVAIVSALVALPGYQVIPYVVDADDTTHHTCVDVGRTMCADGSVFGA